MKFTPLVSMLLIIQLLQSCKNSTVSKERNRKMMDTLLNMHMDSPAVHEGQTNAHNAMAAAPKPDTHLADTSAFNGAFILFLMPDSSRFASLEDEPGIYDADADFGEGISNTIKSLPNNKKYRDYDIKAYTSAKRYISIKDCDGCPLVIDRDTVNYGIILSSWGRSVETNYNQVHSGDYMQEIHAYWGF
jgi:hypothetical protein